MHTYIEIGLIPLPIRFNAYNKIAALLCNKKVYYAIINADTVLNSNFKVIAYVGTLKSVKKYNINEFYFWSNKKNKWIHALQELPQYSPIEFYTYQELVLTINKTNKVIFELANKSRAEGDTKKTSWF